MESSWRKGFCAKQRKIQTLNQWKIYTQTQGPIYKEAQVLISRETKKHFPNKT